jgi:RNA polymerase sigma-70 factor (ECF subfamily)
VRVFNTALSILQHREDAEDVAQEVFIEVYRSLPQFRYDSQISTWIYRITVNKCHDCIRKKNASKRKGLMSIFGRQDDNEISLEKAHFDHPGVLLEHKEEARLLFAAIDLLSENQKTAFVLFHIENLSQKEIADIMELSPKAVESLIQRAKASLREKLKNYFKNQGI